MPDFAFTTLNAASGNTLANGVNVSGQIVGSFGGSHGFLYSGGTFTTVDVPGASSTAAYGISASGQIVGSYTDVFTGFLTMRGPISRSMTPSLRVEPPRSA